MRKISDNSVFCVVTCVCLCFVQSGGWADSFRLDSIAAHILQFYAQRPGRLICDDYTDCFSRRFGFVRGIGRLSEEERERLRTLFLFQPVVHCCQAG